MDRRALLASLAGACLMPHTRAATHPTILLRSGWQAINIGDIAHSPGVLALLERYVPNARLLYWPADQDDAVSAMIQRRFPAVEVVRGRLVDGAPDADVRAAFEAADLLLHGSGPSVVARAQLAAWREQTGKPFGLYGVTIESPDAGLADLLDAAAFVFCRETRSVERVRAAGVRRPPVEFTPDGSFAFDLRDDERSDVFCAAHELGEGFLCVVPRLRYTPYHRLRRTNWSPEEIARREAVNAEFAEADHAKLRAAMIAWARQTGRPIVACAEMSYALELLDELLRDPLPADVRARVVAHRDWWLPDEAASLYARAGCVLSCECHSPILALAAGTPAIYVRQPTDTIKGWMYRDLGLDDWILGVDEVDGATVAERVLAMAGEPGRAEEYRAAAMARAAERHRLTMATVADQAGR